MLDKEAKRKHKARDSRSKKKPQGSRSSVDSPMPDNTSSYTSASSAPKVGKDGAKGKVMDFVKIFSQGATVGAGGESLGQSSRWRAKEVPVTDINKDGAKAKETAKVPDQQKKSTPVTPATVCVSPRSSYMLLWFWSVTPCLYIYSCRTRIRNHHRQLIERFQIR